MYQPHLATRTTGRCGGCPRCTLRFGLFFVGGGEPLGDGLRSRCCPYQFSAEVKSLSDLKIIREGLIGDLPFVVYENESGNQFCRCEECWENEETVCDYPTNLTGCVGIHSDVVRSHGQQFYVCDYDAILRLADIEPSSEIAKVFHDHCFPPCRS
jgi:hypothetical protein